MSDPFSKVTPGQRLTALPAEAWNAFIDAAQANRARMGTKTGDAAPPLNDGQIIRVKNATANDLPRFGVLGLSAPIFAPDATAPATLNEIAFAGVAPATAAHAGGRVAIALAPIVAGEIGPAQIDGACLCQVKAKGAAAAIRMADVADGQTGHLVPASSGLQVLWSAEPTDPDIEETRWAVVRLGGGGGAASQLYKIKSIANDYLVCRAWDGATEGSEDVHVAKPWLLQHDVARYAQVSSLTTVDAQTVEVIVNSVEYVWKVTPTYYVGSLIQASARLTGVTATIDEETVPVDLMDLNHDARAWGEVLQ